jgi:ribosomal protein L12E/L44/L45/RPP1/RPP2
LQAKVNTNMKNLNEEINDIRRRAGLSQLDEAQLDEISRRDVLKGAGVAAAGAAGVGASGNAKAWDQSEFGGEKIQTASNIEEHKQVLKSAVIVVQLMSHLLTKPHVLHEPTKNAVLKSIKENTRLSITDIKVGLMDIAKTLES